MDSEPRLLRLGIVGLGRRWRRYQHALAHLRGKFTIGAVCDPVQQRAENEGRRLGCPAVAGPVALLGRPDLDALLLCDPRWWRLWPLEMACRFGRPVLCATTIAADDPHADALMQHVQGAGVPVMVALAPRCAPALARLRELLTAGLGTPRLVVCEAERCPHQTVALENLGLIDVCTSLLPGAPSAVHARELPTAGLASLSLEMADGRACLILIRPSNRHLVRLSVVTECGSVQIGLPNRLQWRDADGWHRLTLSQPPSTARILLEKFHDVLTGGGAAEPTFAKAYQSLLWLRVARQSAAQGQRLTLE